MVFRGIPYLAGLGCFAVWGVSMDRIFRGSPKLFTIWRKKSKLANFVFFLTFYYLDMDSVSFICFY